MRTFSQRSFSLTVLIRVVYSFLKYLLRAYCVSGSGLEAEGPGEAQKRCALSLFMDLEVQEGRVSSLVCLVKRSQAV